METRTIGVKAKILAAAAFLTAFFSGYIAFFLIGGYVLLREKDEWLRINAVKAGIMMFLFSLADALIDVIPSLFSWLGGFVALFNGYFRPQFIYDAQSLLSSTLQLAEMVLFLLLALFALLGKNLRLPVVDALACKALGILPSLPAQRTVPAPQPPVQPEPAAQPPLQPQAPVQKVCPHCGTPLYNPGAFCPKCGQRLQ